MQLPMCSTELGRGMGVQSAFQALHVRWTMAANGESVRMQLNYVYLVVAVKQSGQVNTRPLIDVIITRSLPSPVMPEAAILLLIVSTV
jgi:hypothetical protein